MKGAEAEREREWAREESTTAIRPETWTNRFQQLSEGEVTEAVNKMSKSAAGLKFLCKECLVGPQKECAKCDTINKDKSEKEKLTQRRQRERAEEEDEFYDEEPGEGFSRRPKPRACRYFISGRCRFGNDCRNRHVGEIEQEKTQSTKAKGGGKPMSHHDPWGNGLWQVDDGGREKETWKIKQRAINE